MPLGAGVGAMGRSGAFALKSKEAGGTLRYMPHAGFQPYINRGTDILDLVNNNGFAVNQVQGLALGSFSLIVPHIVGVTAADFFTRAFGSTYGDTDASNYHIMTVWPDGNGSTPDVHDLCKFGSMSSRVRWDPSGQASAIVYQMGGLIIDPESGTATALTTPSAGALSTGNVLGAAQATLTGVTDYVEFAYTISTSLGVSLGRKAGTNANYPTLCKGLLMGGQVGSVAVTQHRSATTVIGADGSAGTITLTIGTTGAGVAKVFRIIPVGLGKPSTLGPNYRVHNYRLKSTDGTTAPYTCTDL